MSHNGHDAATDQLERDIASERAALRRALNALNENSSPDTLARDVLRLAGLRDDDLALTAWRTVRENPAVSAATGAGLAWLVYRAIATQPASESVMRGRIDDTIDTLRTALKDGRLQAEEKLRDTYDDAKATAEKVTRGASRKAQQGASELAGMAREHPMTTAALVVAAAAALAGVASRSASQSSRSDSTLDDLRDENRQLRQLISEALNGRH